jgi:GntR family transcriptional repressor for pyruvate dehydrogenase complex
MALWFNHRYYSEKIHKWSRLWYTFFILNEKRSSMPERNEKSGSIQRAFLESMAGKIIQGQLKPGDRLPSEREIAAEEGISRSAVHLALSQLEQTGFLKTNARHGTYVDDYVKNGNIQTLNLLIRFNGLELPKARIRDMLEMRMAVEGKALELLCAKLTQTDVETLRKDIEDSQAVEESDPDALARSFFAFHHDICVCSGNFILALLFNTFDTITLAYWRIAIDKLGKKRCIELLEGMLKCITSRKAEDAKNYLEHEFRIFLRNL